jgi:hypothetical protein
MIPISGTLLPDKLWHSIEPVFVNVYGAKESIPRIMKRARICKHFRSSGIDSAGLCSLAGRYVMGIDSRAPYNVYTFGHWFVIEIIEVFFTTEEAAKLRCQ